MTPDPITAQAIAITVQARVVVLWGQRQRDRRSPMRAEWSQARHDREVVLRELLRLLHVGRRLARETVEREDAVSAAKAYAELGYHGAQAAYDEPATAAAGPITEAELWGGYGVREVDPEFNPGWVMGPGDDQPRYDPDGGGIAGESPDLNREGDPAFNGAWSR
jgi:hypothetical protein